MFLCIDIIKKSCQLSKVTHCRNQNNNHATFYSNKNFKKSLQLLEVIGIHLFGATLFISVPCFYITNIFRINIDTRHLNFKWRNSRFNISALVPTFKELFACCPTLLPLLWSVHNSICRRQRKS